MPHSWGYTVANGPHTWANKFEEAGGIRQSPIHIETHEASLDPSLSADLLRWVYPNQTDSLHNTGHGWKVNVDGEGSVLEGGPLRDTYQLEQYHCHWGEHGLVGSEHVVDGNSYAAEIHFVHWNTKYGSMNEAVKHGDGLAVLGVFLKEGKENPDLKSLTKAISGIKFKHQTVEFKEDVPTKLIPENHAYWTYLGSLTTPPCSECVVWIVFKDPIEISHEQLEAFRALKCKDEDGCCGNDDEDCIRTNFRPTLPKGDRCLKASYS